MLKEKCTFCDNAWQWSGEGLPAPVIVLHETGSVLDDAWELLQKDQLPEWACVLAHSQSSGRGQTRRQWQSPAGNIYVALRLPWQSPFNTTAAAPALSMLITKVLRDFNCNLRIKWPNDLVVNLQKVGGILLEERQGVIIAGIGINLIKAPSNSQLRHGAALQAGVLPVSSHMEQNLTSCNNILFSDEISLNERLWLYLVRNMYFCYKHKLPVNWAQIWHHEAEYDLLWLGQRVSLEDTDGVVTGVLKGLGANGELVLLVNGQEQYFLSGSLNFSG